MVIIIVTVLCFIVTVVTMSFDFLLPFYLSHKYNIDLRGASSIGIIGAVDGPTSIFISNLSALSASNLTVIFTLLSIIGMTYLFITKEKK